MCTLIVAWKVAGGPDLFVIANRDEDRERPSSGPGIRQVGDLRALSPRDEKAGGSWIGLNEAGVFAGITNRFGMEPGPEYRSRGELVLKALAYRTSRQAAEAIYGLSATDYNGFHLVIADQEEAFVVWSDGVELYQMELEPGYYGFSERSFGAAPSRRLERLQARLEGLDGWSKEREAQLRRWMSERDGEDALEGTCICTTERYGTVSSSVIEVDRQKEWRYLYADGPPCEVDYEEQAVSVLN